MKFLVTISMVAELEDEYEAFDLQQQMEKQIRLGVVAGLERNGKTIDDLDGLLTFFGASVQSARDPHEVIG